MTSPKSSLPSWCARCGGALGLESTGAICSACEFAAAMSPPEAGTATDSPEDPRRFGDYELVEEIAHGGMGVVYRARQVKLNRVVALKMLLLGPFASDQSIRRFRREAQAAAALSHPGIVGVYEVGEVEGQPYFTMELIEGRNLASRLQSGPLTAQTAAQYLHTVAEAVAHAHAQGIVHRDLKPSNILIDLSEGTHITDFGLARRFDGVGGITLTGNIAGSPNYLAPEILSGRQEQSTAPVTTTPIDTGEDRTSDPGPPESSGGVSSKQSPVGRPKNPCSPVSDLFSLGAILYECLTGRPPFLGATLEETLLRVRDTEPVAPRVLNPHVPRDLETICLKCLEKNPNSRYASAAELAAELRRFLDGHPILARPVPPLSKAWRWAQRKPALAAVSAALLVTLLTGLTGVLWQWHRAESEAGRANRIAADARKNVVRQFVSKGNELAGRKRTLEALPWFLAALENDTDPARLEAHRLRLSTALRQSPRLEWVWSHAHAIKQLALSRDGRWIASASEDATARVWDLASGQPVTPPLPHGETVIGVSFHPQRDLLLTSSSQREHRPTLGSRAIRGKGSVRLWSLPDGRELWSALQTNILSQAEFNPDGSRILVACADGRARLWRVEPVGDSVVVSLNFEFEHSAEVRAATFSPSGDRLATGARDGRYRVWDASSHRLLQEFDNSQGEVDFLFYARRWEVTFSPDGRKLLGGNDERARLWNLNSGTNLFDLPIPNQLTSLRFSPNGQRILTADTGGTIRIWDATSGKLTAQINSHDQSDALASDLAADFGPTGSRVALWDLEGVQFRDPRSAQATPPYLPTRLVTAVLPTPEGRRLIVGTGAGKIQVWNLVPSETTGRKLDLGDVGTRVRFSADGRRVITGNWSSRVDFWDAETGRSILSESHHQRSATYGVQWIEPSPDEKQVLVTDWGGTARLYDFSTGQPLSPLWTNTLGIPSVGTFLPDGKMVATADRAGVLRVHRLPEGTCVRSVTNAEAWPFQQVLASADGAILYTVSNDGWGRRWETATLEPRGAPFKLGGVSREARLSPDGRRLVTATATAAPIRVWDAATGQLELELFHPVAPCLAEFSPDGRWIASASDDGTVRLWESHTGALQFQVIAGTKPLDLEFSRDGRWLACGGTFGLRAWEVSTGEAITPLLEFDPQEAYANGIAFSPDGFQLAGAGGSGARIWNLRPAPYSLVQWQQLISALTGKRVDERGELQELSDAEFEAVRAAARREFPAELVQPTAKP